LFQSQLVLLLDEALQGLPVEMMPSLATSTRFQSITRDFTLAVFLRRLDAAKDKDTTIEVMSCG